VAFKHFFLSKKEGSEHSGVDRREVLYNVLSDTLFQRATSSSADLANNRKSLEETVDTEKLAFKVREDWDKARGTAWALVYYLIQNKKFPNLLRYRQEIASMPRDLDLDEKSLEACFARGFELSDARDPRKLD